MLRIVDTRTGRPVEIPSVRRHLLSVCVHLPVSDAGIGMTDLRVLLVGDVLARTAELNGLQSSTFLTTPDLPPEQAQVFDRAMSALDVHPPAIGGVHHPDGTLRAAADVHVHAYETAAQDAVGGVRVDVPSGAEFERFAFLDRFLVLDLAREVGHQHRAAT
jgi:hypothetical protein